MTKFFKIVENSFIDSEEKEYKYKKQKIESQGKKGEDQNSIKWWQFWK